jgi:hypothetical protein
MKTILTICFIVTLACGLTVQDSRASDYSGLDSRIRQIRGSIEIQIERIKSAREKSDNEMSLARIRLAEQLRRSEEDLYRQVATLERFHEQLANQVTEAKGAVAGYQKNLKSPMEQALADIEAQLKDTNALMARMEAARNDLDSQPQAGPSFKQSAGSAPPNETKCQPANSGSASASLPDMRLSPQSQASVLTERQASGSKAPTASDISEPEVRATTPAITEPPTEQPASPETPTGG